MPDEHETLAGRDSQIDVIEDGRTPLGFAHITKFDREHPGN